MNRVQSGEAPQFLKIDESGEFKRGSIAESKESYRIETYGRVVGRAIYAVGGSYEASRLAGLRVERSLPIAYIAPALAAAVAGVLVASEINSGSPVLGNDTALYAIAAVLLGGISMQGGSGSLLGMLQGVLILGILTNGLNISGVGGFYQIVVVGSLLISPSLSIA